LADAISAFFGSLKYWLADPTLNGGVGWIGLVLTVGGFVAAIIQIRKAKSAAEAAAVAVNAMTRKIFVRERLLELGSAISHINSAIDRITQSKQEAALVFIDFSIAECVQIHELLDASEQRKFYKFIVRLRKLAEDISSAQSSGDTENYIGTALEARNVAGAMSEMAARLRYGYEREGSKE
jgi:hypothetical protein